MEYGYSERRKNKNDKKAKSRYGRFRIGGSHRSDNIGLKKGKKD